MVFRQQCTSKRIIPHIPWPLAKGDISLLYISFVFVWGCWKKGHAYSEIRIEYSPRPCTRNATYYLRLAIAFISFCMAKQETLTSETTIFTIYIFIKKIIHEININRPCSLYMHLSDVRNNLNRSITSFFDRGIKQRRHDKAHSCFPYTEKV